MKVGNTPFVSDPTLHSSGPQKTKGVGPNLPAAAPRASPKPPDPEPRGVEHRQQPSVPLASLEAIQRAQSRPAGGSDGQSLRVGDLFHGAAPPLQATPTVEPHVSGPTHPNAPDYADNFEKAWYDPKTDSIYASYEGPGVTVRYPLSEVVAEPGTPEQDASAIASSKKRDGIWVPAALNRHTTPRLAKLAKESRDWKLAWQNADAMTQASLQLLPIVSAYGGQGVPAPSAGGAAKSGVQRGAATEIAEGNAASRMVPNKGPATGAPPALPREVPRPAPTQVPRPAPTQVPPAAAGLPKVVPQITPAANREMVGQAVGHVKSLPGGAAEKADLFEKLGEQITAHSGHSWRAKRGAGTDGSHVFLGDAGEALIISPAGEMFRGSLQNGSIAIAGLKRFHVNYAAMRKL